MASSTLTRLGGPSSVAAGFFWLLVWFHKRQTHGPTQENEECILLGLGEGYAGVGCSGAGTGRADNLLSHLRHLATRRRLAFAQASALVAERWGSRAARACEMME